MFPINGSGLGPGGTLVRDDGKVQYIRNKMVIAAMDVSSVIHERMKVSMGWSTRKREGDRGLSSAALINVRIVTDSNTPIGERTLNRLSRSTSPPE